MTEDRDFLTRQVIAMIEEEASDLIGAVPCPGNHGVSTWCTGCGAQV